MGIEILLVRASPESQCCVYAHDTPSAAKYWLNTGRHGIVPACPSFVDGDLKRQS